VRTLRAVLGHRTPTYRAVRDRKRPSVDAPIDAMNHRDDSAIELTEVARPVCSTAIIRFESSPILLGGNMAIDFPRWLGLATGPGHED